MSRAQQKRFLRRYSRSDLNAPKSRRLTGWIVRSLGMILALLMVSGTTTFWIRPVQKARLEASPMAKSLWVGQPGNADKIFTEKKLALLEEKISQQLGPNSQVAINRFSRLYLHFRFNPKSNDYIGLYGRTVEQGDPILSRLHDEPLPDTPGIVLTRELLRWLGYKDEENPEEIQLRFGADKPWVKVPVLFIADVSLPYEMKFFIRQADYAALYLQGHEQTATGIKLGPIDRHWPGPSQFNQDFDLPVFFSNKGLKTPVRGGSRDMGLYYELKSVGNVAWSTNHWETLAQEFREEMVKYVQTEMPHVEVKPESLTVLDESRYFNLVSPNPPEPGDYELAEVRVQELLDLKPTAAGCREAGYPADETLVKQVDQVHKVGLLLLAALGAITLSLLLIAFVIMFIVQKLRCELKIPEIGMLKGMGLSGGDFLKLFFYQALEFWWRSVLFGGLLAFFGGVPHRSLYRHQRDRNLVAGEVFRPQCCGGRRHRLAGDLSQSAHRHPLGAAFRPHGFDSLGITPSTAFNGKSRMMPQGNRTAECLPGLKPRNFVGGGGNFLRYPLDTTREHGKIDTLFL